MKAHRLAQAKINPAICLVHQDHPEDGGRLATGTLATTRADTGPNLQQAGEFLTALTLRHRDLPATRDSPTTSAPSAPLITRLAILAPGQHIDTGAGVEETAAAPVELTMLGSGGWMATLERVTVT